VDEEILAGGVANPGSVIRVGDTVRRPRKPQTETVHHFLRYLVEHGLEGVVPTPLGYDESGREVLSYLDGEIALPPSNAWVAGDDLLVSVAELQRRLQLVARDYVPPTDAVWDDDAASGYLPAGSEGAVVCHNDLCVENVVIDDDGHAAAVIDFDYAGPVDPLFDTAVAARHWAPVRAPEDLEALGIVVDPVARFQLFLDVSGIVGSDRARVVELLDRFLERAYANVQRLAADGHPGFAEMVAGGYAEQNRRSSAWLRAHADELAG
jgi:hypothetical protein